MRWGRTILTAVAIAGALVAPVVAEAQSGCGMGRCGPRPYGDYCRRGGWGRYGARQPVKDAEDARRRLEEYYADGQVDVVVGAITERKLYFEADIKDPKENLLDRVIIDKRSGRIRSIL